MSERLPRIDQLLKTEGEMAGPIGYKIIDLGALNEDGQGPARPFLDGPKPVELKEDESVEATEEVFLRGVLVQYQEAESGNLFTKQVLVARISIVAAGEKPTMVITDGETSRVELDFDDKQQGENMLRFIREMKGLKEVEGDPTRDIVIDRAISQYIRSSFAAGQAIDKLEQGVSAMAVCLESKRGKN